MKVAASSQELTVSDFTVRGVNGPIGKVYGEALLEAASHDSRIVCLSADLTPATETDLFRDSLPDRFFNLGIAEANMVGVAGGMARSGDIPFIHTFSVFATRRCYDQIAMQAAYPKANVKIVGFLPGLTTVLGVSHQAIDDLALMRGLPNMMVIEPADTGQIKSAVQAAIAYQGPVYLRLKRSDGALPETFAHRPLTPGRVEMRRTGKDGLILASGLMVEAAEQAAEMLAMEGLSVSVANVATVKPLDREIAALAAAAGTVVTAENHSIIGGLGSAVAELLMEEGVNVGFARVGVRDTFAEGGSTNYLLARYGLTASDIVRAFHQARRS
ncbi:transketolase family protein [Mesorhizobium sp. ANAO-SY3R2]|uniref:transketolase family protein n=1 Tax=Mesorhizobium sp. ANAO-SY3R2 TaxID=3166644 RepID=UPI00366F3DB0